MDGHPGNLSIATAAAVVYGCVLVRHKKVYRNLHFSLIFCLNEQAGPGLKARRRRQQASSVRPHALFILIVTMTGAHGATDFQNVVAHAKP